MTSSRPYLLRAIYEWIVDNGLTPHILVNAEINGVQVPGEYIQDGRIVLNIAPHATQQLQMGNDYLMFSARFSGSSRQLEVPIEAVLAVYARENGMGMEFAEEQTAAQAESEPDTQPQGQDDDDEPPPRGSRPALRVVK